MLFHNAHKLLVWSGYSVAESVPTPEAAPTQVFLQMVDSGSLLSWMTERSDITNR
jgi:hypothetical protein